MEGWGELARPLNRVFQKKNQGKNIRYRLFLILTHTLELSLFYQTPFPPHKKGEKLKIIQKYFVKKQRGVGGGKGGKKRKKKTLNIFFF